MPVPVTDPDTLSIAESAGPDLTHMNREVKDAESVLSQSPSVLTVDYARMESGRAAPLPVPKSVSPARTRHGFSNKPLSRGTPVDGSPGQNEVVADKVVAEGAGAGVAVADRSDASFMSIATGSSSSHNSSNFVEPNQHQIGYPSRLSPPKDPPPPVKGPRETDDFVGNELHALRNF